MNFTLKFLTKIKR